MGRRATSFTVADCATFPTLFYLRAIHRWDTDAHANITRYYRALLARPSIARVVEEARPLPGRSSRSRGQRTRTSSDPSS